MKNNQMKNNIMMNNIMMNNQILNQMMNNPMKNNSMKNNPMINNNMMASNIMNNNMLCNNIMNNNSMVNNMMISNNMMDNSKINVKMKMDLLFQEIFPMFNSMNQNDIQIRKDFELEFLKIFKAINKIKNQEKKKDENMIIINYYNLCKKEIYLDLELKVEYLISNILTKMGYNYGIKVIKRNKKSQTTKYIIENPIFELSEDMLNIYKILFFFEFNDENLLKSFDKKGYEIGLKEGKEIIIKLNNNNIKDTLLPGIKLNVNFNTPSGSIFLVLSVKETMLSAMKLYFLKEGIDFKLINNVIFFLWKGNIIKKDDFHKTLDQLFYGESLIFITVIRTDGLIGAGPKMMEFVDASSGKIKLLEFNEKAPLWRMVNKGLNIFGICNNSKCKAWKKEVVYPTDLNEGLTFVLDEEMLNIKCPLCSRIIKPKTCGFWKCEYQFVGQKIEEGELKYYDSKTKETDDNNFQYFDIFENGQVEWIGLTIYVLPKQKIRYQSD